MNGAALKIWNLALIVAVSWSLEASSDPVNGTWFLSVDNDVFAGTDDDYSSGVQIGWVPGYLDHFGQGRVPEFVAAGLGYLPLVNRKGRQQFISHSLSHRIFTPTDIETSELIANDTPYSGSLFASLTAGAQDAKTMDAFTFYYGIVGPSARGDEVQNKFHRLIDADVVNGWDNQLGDELLLNLAYEHRSRLWRVGSTGGWGGDVISQIGGSVGNLISMATVGLGARCGWGVPDDFGIPPQFFGEETIGSRPYTAYGRKTGVWLFALLNGSYISNAIFWDGNTFKDSPSVDYDPGIARLYFGINARVGQWSGSFAITKTTVPWENPTNRKRQTYGRIGIRYTF